VSYKVVQLVLGADPEKLLPAMKRFVLSVLASYAAHDGTGVRPGLARLARQCGLSTDQVYRWRRLLRVEGWIVQVRKSTFKKPAVYRINIKKLQDAVWQGIRADAESKQATGIRMDAERGIRTDAGRVSAPMQGPLSAPMQTEKSSNRPTDGPTEVRERVAPSPPLGSPTNAPVESEEEGWDLEGQLVEVNDAIIVDEDKFSPTDRSIVGSVEARFKRGLPIPPALEANFEGIFNKALAITNAKIRDRAAS